jgi:hypothetical protein
MPPTFGKRGLIGAPALSAPPQAPPRRRLRSNAVVVGAVGLLALGGAALGSYREYHCQPPKKGEPDNRPGWCFSRGYGHSSGGHGWGFAGGVGHASFGGFGAHGAGHGGGS